MGDIVLEMDHVSKKFKKGEIHDSLRDLIPAFYKRLVKGGRTETLRRNEFWALRDICFYLNKGEALGIIGSNGAGKSTILKLLSGIMQPTEGALKVNGTFSALIEVGAGFHPDLTGRDNIFLNGTILGMRREQIKAKFDEIVDFSGLADFIDTPVKRYSSGMYARLGFSVAAHVDPDIMLVDEVLSVGDYSFQNKCIAKMKSIIRGGATVIFVSHNLRAVTDMCSRCILLDHGKIAKEGAAKEVIACYQNLADHGEDGTDKEVFISKAIFHSENGQNLQFTSGQKAFFDVEITGKEACDKLSVSFYLVDNEGHDVFNTSTERLNYPPLNLKPGETKKVTFQVDLHLAPGTYYVGTLVYRYDIQKKYDDLGRAATIYVTCKEDIRGIANLYPRVKIE